jgi:hypothetical protein
MARKQTAADIRKLIAASVRLAKAAEPAVMSLPLTATQRKRLDQQLRKSSPAWRALLGLPPEAISKQLREQWRDLKTPSVIKLAALIAKAAPTAIAVSAHGVWLLMTHSRQPKVAPGSGLTPADFDIEQYTFWLSEPIALEKVAAAFRALKLRAPKSAIEFFSRLGALRDCEPPMAGNFNLPSRDAVFPTGDDDLYTGSDVPKWKGAAIVHYAPNGDRILLNQSGRTAWTQFETDEITPIGTFDEMLNEYRAAAARCSGIDSWGSDV